MNYEIKAFYILLKCYSTVYTEASFNSLALKTEPVLNSNYSNSKEGGVEPVRRRERR